MINRIYIGIDPGNNIGLAAYADSKPNDIYLLTVKDVNTKSRKELSLTAFYRLVTDLKELCPNSEVIVCIEDHTTAPLFGGKANTNKAQQIKIARNVGQVDFIYKAINFFCNSLNFTVTTRKPNRRGKLSLKQFETRHGKINGYSAKSVTSHSLDAFYFLQLIAPFSDARKKEIKGLKNVNELVKQICF